MLNSGHELRGRTNDGSDAMSNDDRDVWITGIGLLSSLGEGADAHWSALTGKNGPVIDEEAYAPYPVHPLVEVDYATQIKKRGDLRQMEPWQRIGTYTAGLALADAGLAGDLEALDKMDMIVAAGSGERDAAMDQKVLEETTGANANKGISNDILKSELRPTLFLAQLSNLLAGNISIVHKVTGSSRTYMGEELAGLAALENAFARIDGGQSDLMLIGGANNAERKDALLIFELGKTSGVINSNLSGNAMVAVWLWAVWGPLSCWNRQNMRALEVQKLMRSFRILYPIGAAGMTVRSRITSIGNLISYQRAWKRQVLGLCRGHLAASRQPPRSRHF